MTQDKKKTQSQHFHVSAKDREFLVGNLGLLLKSGVAVGEALQSLQETSSSRNLKLAVQQMQRDIEDGSPLWKAMSASGIVSQQTLALVEIGEQSGKLVENMRVASKQEEKQRAFRSKVRSALIYPTFVLGLTLIVGLGVAWFLLPRLAATFSQLNADLPFISKIFIGFGVFLKTNGLWAVPLGFVVVGVTGYILFGAPKTKVIGLRMLFHIPGVSKLLYEIEIARFGYLAGTLLEAGLSVTQALELMSKATTAPQYRLFYQYLGRSFEDGYGFRASLPKYHHVNKLLPPAVQQMVIAGERSGALPEALRNIGEIYEEKSDTSTRNLEAIMEPVLLIIVWVGVFGVAVAVILPIYSLVGGLGT